MAAGVRRGEIWLFAFEPPDKRRPVLVLTRDSVIPFLHSVLVAPITGSVRGIPSEVVVGTAQGLKKTSAVNLDHVQSVSTHRLSRRVGRLDGEKMREVCAALAIATGCDTT
jgi:mRNA interferase MazF